MTFRDDIIKLAFDNPGEFRDALLSLFDDPSVTKRAMKPETATFIAWALRRGQAKNESQVSTFIERVTGRAPTTAPMKRRKGGLQGGETVLVDKYRNANESNERACDRYHDQVGVVGDVELDGVTVHFERGSAYFDGLAPGKGTGLYRWTPKADYQEGAVSKKILIELVYLKGGQTPPPRRDIEQVQRYIEKGLGRGETRSRVYYTGYVGRFAINKRGQMYFTLSSQQRDRPTAINPTEGECLYIGLAGRRPGGWKAEAQKWGLGF